MKKSFTSTCQYFLLHSMLTFMIAQVTHASSIPVTELLGKSQAKYVAKKKASRNDKINGMVEDNGMAIDSCTEKASSLYQENELEDAPEQDNKAVKLFSDKKETKDLINEANDYFNAGVNSAAKQNEKGNKAAVKAFNKAIKRYQTLGGHKKDIVSAACQLAAVRINMKNQENALSVVRRVLKEYGDLTTEPVHLIPIFNQLAGICRYDLKENNLAIQYYLKVINLCSIERSCVLEKITAYFYLGDLYQEEGNLKAAIEYYEKGIEEPKTVNIQPLFVANAQNQLGNIYAKKPYLNHDKAEQYYLSALSIYENGKNNFFLAEIKLNLAIFYLDKQKDYDNAIKSFKDAIDYYSKVKTQNRKIKRKIAVIYFKLANAYQLQQKCELAIVAFNEAIPLYRVLDDMLSVAKAKFNIALCNKKNKQLSLAEVNYKEAKDLFKKEKGGAVYVAQCDKNLGDLCFMQEEIEEALHHYTAFYKASDHVSKKICAIERLVRVYLKLSNHKKTIQLQEEALVLLTDKYGENSLKVADKCNDLGRVYFDAKQWKQAIKYDKRALKIRKEKLDKNDRDIALSYTHLGISHFENKQYKEARKKTAKALEILESHNEKDNDMIIRNIVNLAYAYREQNKHEEAEEHFDKAMERCIEHFGANHLCTAKIYDDKAMYYFTQEKMEQAYDVYNQALAIRKIAFGDNASELATSYMMMGDICYRKESYNESIEAYNKAIEIFDKTLPMHLDTAKAYNSRGSAYAYRELYEKGIEDHKKAKKIYIKQSGAKSKGVAITCKLLGHCYVGIHDYGNAIKSHDIALQIDQNLRTSTAEMASDYHELGVCFGYNGNYEQAAKNHRKSLKKIEKCYGKQSIEAAYKCADIADAYSNLEKYKLAEPFYKKSIIIREKQAKKVVDLKKDYFDLRKAYVEMGLNSYHLGKHKDVIKYVPKYLKIQQETCPDELNKSIVTLRTLLSDSYFADENYKEAINISEKTIEIISLPFFQGSPEMKRKKANLLYNMSRAECCLRNYEKALKNCTEALEIHKKECGDNDKRVASDLYCIGLIHKNLLPSTNPREQYNAGISYFEEAQKLYEYHKDFELSKKCKKGASDLRRRLSSLGVISYAMQPIIQSKAAFY